MGKRKFKRDGLRLIARLQKSYVAHRERINCTNNARNFQKVSNWYSITFCGPPVNKKDITNPLSININHRNGRNGMSVECTNVPKAFEIF